MMMMLLELQFALINVAGHPSSLLVMIVMITEISNVGVSVVA